MASTSKVTVPVSKYAGKSLAELQAILAEKEAAEEARLRREAQKETDVTVNGLTLRVSEKGAVSVYGVGRFPVTLYGESWLKVIGIAPSIVQYISSNQNKLAVKAPKATKS